MLEEFLNHKLFIVIPRNRIDRLEELDERIGHIKFPSGASMPLYVQHLLKNCQEVGIIGDSFGRVLYSVQSYETANYVSIDEFLGKEITIDEEDFDLIFEKEKI